jgi:hypothetical protein
MQGISSQSGRYRKRSTREPLAIQPTTIDEVVSIMTNTQKFPSPVRAMGAGSSNTRCSNVQEGTRLDMTGMNRIVQLRAKTVTVQAGMRLRDLARKLAEHDLELTGSYDQPDRTVGGVISSGSPSASLPDDGGHLASSVCGMKFVTARGRIIELTESDEDALKMMRQSYGTLGIICRVTLRIRRIRSYSVRHGKAGFAKFTTLVPSLSKAQSGVKLYLLPFKDRVYIELREASESGKNSHALRWKIQDYLVNRILPDIVYTLGRAFSFGPIRDPLIDGFGQATQMLVNTTLVDAGSNAAEQTGQFRKVGASSRTRHCTWLFPADRFGAALYSYREFCRKHYKATGFRCDLPSVGHRIPRDQQAMLSPSFDGPVFALNLRSTNIDGWDDFLLDFANIATHFGGIPLFNQTRGFSPEQVKQAYGKRLMAFQAMRTKADPDGRLLNQFFTEHLA